MKYVKTFENFSGDVLSKDLQAYRVENMRKPTYMEGKLYVDSLEHASQFGEQILINTLKKGMKVYDMDKDGAVKSKSLKSKLLKQGYEVTKKETDYGVEYVVLKPTELPKDKFYFKIGWSDNFDFMAGEPCWFYFDANKKEQFWILSPVGNHHDVELDPELQKYKNKYVLFDVEKAAMIKDFDTDQEALIWFDTYMIAGTLPK
jgi:hypothetical protein